MNLKASKLIKILDAVIGVNERVLDSILKRRKSFECLCSEGFTGVFCDYKIEAKSLLFMHGKESYLFNMDGSYVGNTDTISEDVEIRGSCLTMFMGEALVFGGLRSWKHESRKAFD